MLPPRPNVAVGSADRGALAGSSRGQCRLSSFVLARRVLRTGIETLHLSAGALPEKKGEGGETPPLVGRDRRR